MATLTQRYGQPYTGADATPAAAAARQATDMAKYFPSTPAPTTPTPTTPTTPVPTPTTPTPITRSPDAYQQSLDAAATAADSRASLLAENQRYAATQRQARIDAINTAFAPRIAREQQAGDARLSRVAALNFKSGVIGSGVDTTNTSEQTKLNNDALQAIEDTKATAIQDAFDKADALARQMTEDQYSAATKSAEANVAAQKNRLDTATASLKSFASSGKVTSAADLQKVDPVSYNNLKTVTGMTDGEMDAYLKVNAPAGEYQWSAAQIHGSKMVVPTVKNGVTGLETIDLGFTPDKTVKDVAKVNDGVIITFSDGTYKTIGSITPSPSNAGFTLQPGETRYDANGNPIVTSPQTKLVGELTPSQKATGVNYLLNNGGTPADLEKFDTDRAYQAWILNKTQ